MSKQSFRAKLESRIHRSQSLLCIGLDPHSSQLTSNTAEAAKEFCARIISETHPYAACYKPNIAFFEYFGESGLVVLKEILEMIPSDIPVIMDAKRGDIDTTAQAYASALLKNYNTDSVTLSPYMGWDSIQPFVTNDFAGYGVFILCKTSNLSSSEIQSKRLLDGTFVFEHVLARCLAWQEKVQDSLVGVVAGATDIFSLRLIREKAPETWILCPGVGAQNGELKLVCPAGLRADGSGLLISVSRAISKAENMSNAAMLLRDEINRLREEHMASVVSKCFVEGSSNNILRQFQRDFIYFALDQRALQFGSFTLKSGRQSPYFFNAGNLCSGQSIHTLGRCYAQAVKEAGVEFDVVFGPAYKGIPLATAFAMSWFQLYGESIDVAYNRKEVKDHGEGGQLVGAVVREKRVLIIDDVITAGTAIRESVTFLTTAGANIVGTVVSLDRQEKAGDEVLSAIQQVERDYNFPVFAIVRLQDLVQFLQQSTDDEKFVSQAASMQAYRELYGVN